ncbi:hypothetical protein ASPZODRAFT_74689 [Penicilliopsis zonata CBS 506.65]|uniref:Uncharacterized protein n=1 Tax=Penicilliopsis zonata CBS 506.65 TaxID=1073090 RepID=A0A1L9S7Y0_9EURO|nr:hypothetical protein ASPZODRAFT_74689 [Penicilliopsis zonata CBS 506.65]OJJ43269.1 hypothetical protein ASPZODRAFT_74689 [Penicilliopsis zonata CBS 506.65]
MEAVRARRNIAKATKPNDSKPTHSAGESSKAESSGDLATSSPDNSNDIIIATNLKERINAMYFTSWGSPEPRPANRPRPEHRRVILQNLPESHRTPTSVLSLVHGGSIERVGVIPSGSAHVTFTESKACVTYYEQYRQTGIRLPGGHVVRVTRGKEEIANSVTRGYLDKGVTRVVRISSLPLEVSMGVLVELAVDNGRQLEKIEDTYTREGVSQLPACLFAFISVTEYGI